MSERVDPLWSALAFLLGAAALASVSAVTGAGLIQISTALNKPALLVLLLLVLLPAAVLGTFASPRIAVAAVMAAFIAGPGPTKAAVVFFATLVILSRIGVGKTPIVWAPALWWAIALFCWVIVSLGSAVAPTLAAKSTVVLFLGILFAIVVLAASRSMKDARWILGAFVLVATILVGRALAHLGQLQAVAGTTTVNNRLQGEFGSPNQLGSFCDLGMFVAAGMALGARSRLGRLGAALAFLLMLTGLAFSLSRGAWIGAILALLFLLVVLREARVLAVAIGVPMIVVAWLIGSFAPGNTQIQVVTQRVGAITLTSPYDNRPQIYAEAIREIKTHPWVGYGPGNFPVSSLRSGSEASSVYALHAHDIWLTWGAEAGIPAVLIILGLMAALGVAVRKAEKGADRRGDRRDRALVAGVAAALVTVIGQGVVDYTLRNVVIFMALWGLIGTLLVMRREGELVPVGAEAWQSEPEREPMAQRPDGGVLEPKLPAERSASHHGLAAADRDLERRERRLAAQREALNGRRGRLEEMLKSLRESERELAGRRAAFGWRAAEANRRDEQKQAARLLAEVEATLDLLAECERTIDAAVPESAAAAEGRWLASRTHRLEEKIAKFGRRDRARKSPGG